MFAFVLGIRRLSTRTVEDASWFSRAPFLLSTAPVAHAFVLCGSDDSARITPPKRGCAVRTSLPVSTAPLMLARSNAPGSPDRPPRPPGPPSACSRTGSPASASAAAPGDDSVLTDDPKHPNRLRRPLLRRHRGGRQGLTAATARAGIPSPRGLLTRLRPFMLAHVPTPRGDRNAQDPRNGPERPHRPAPRRERRGHPQRQPSDRRWAAPEVEEGPLVTDLVTGVHFGPILSRRASSHAAGRATALSTRPGPRP